MPPENTDKTARQPPHAIGDFFAALVPTAVIVLTVAVSLNARAAREFEFIPRRGDLAHSWSKWGWPITYRLHECWLWAPAPQSAPVLSAEWRCSSAIAFAANCLTFLAVFGIAAFLIGAYYRRQFTVRALFGLIFCAAVILSGLTSAGMLGVSESQEPPPLSEFRQGVPLLPGFP